MRVVIHQSIARSAVTFSLLLCASFPCFARADALEAAQMLPDDVMVMISVESIKDLQAALEKTSLYRFYKDPAIQQVVGPAEKKIRAQLDTTLKDFWREAKMDNPPEQIPYPEGRVIFGLSLVAPPKPVDTNTPPSPSAGNQDDDSEEGDEEETDAGPPVQVRMVLLADMGSRAAQARQVVQALVTNVIGVKGALQKKEVAGIPMDIAVPPEGVDAPQLCFGFKDTWLLVTADETNRLDFTEAVARRVGRTLPDGLGDKPGLRAAAQTLGAAHVFAFLNPDALKAFLKSSMDDKGAFDRIVKSLGLANITSVAIAARIAEDRSQDMSAKILVGIQGTPTGLPALLVPASGSLNVNERLLTRDAVGFVCANYEPARLFDDLNKIVQDAVYQDLNMIAQAGLAATAGDGGQPPVQLRDDVLAQLGAPLLVTWKMDRPYKPGSPFKFLLALPVRDGGRLEAAVGRIHKAFLGSDPKSCRELLGHTLYLLSQPGADPTGTRQMALSVAGDHLVFGPVDEVEQALRALQKEPQDSLASDPMFRAARERLPSQAALYVYRNDRLSGELGWAVFQEMVRNFGAFLEKEAQANTPQDRVDKVVLPALQSIDWSQLPDFKTVEKYWGTTVGFLQRRPEGLYWESTAFKPAQP